MTILRNCSPKDEIKWNIRTFQSVPDKTEFTVYKVDWNFEENEGKILNFNFLYEQNMNKYSRNSEINDLELTG